MDEFGNFYDAAGNIIEDPKKTETDIALAGLEHMSTYDKVEYNKLKKNKALGIELTPEEEKRLDELQKKRDYKPEVKPISLVDLTDTGRDDPTSGPTGDGGFGDETGKRGGMDTVDDFSDEAWGTDESMAAPTTGDSGSDSFFDAVDTKVAAKAPSGPPAGGPHGGAPSAPSASTSSPGHPSNRGGGGGNGGCFVKGTPITMADGSTKPVEQVDLEDEVAEGGKVFAAGRFLTEELHDYEGIKVSGSHMVNEDGTWVRVRDSEKGKPLGEDEHTVYVFGAENRRILINGILFTDYFEVKEQDQLATTGDKYFEKWKDHDKILVNLEEQNNVAVLNR